VSEHTHSPRVGKLLLFWDYDTQWGADRSRLPGGPKSWGHLEFRNTDRLLELLEKFQVRACFAVVGAAALAGDRPYHDPRQVRKIHAAGHEIGSHSHRHEWLPGLDRRRLYETLRSSKDALEQCIGASVTAFVPPWNQPFDHPAGLSFSLSERREARDDRTDLRTLCETLLDAGYRFCRVAYRPFLQRALDRLLRRRFDHLGRLESIAGITCARLNTPGGFDGDTMRALERNARRRSLTVAYGHPHSLTLGSSQDERHFVPFLERVRELRSRGLLEVACPRDLHNGATVPL
jgi:peptidoglycan/xylan/chitin deacetylase (PgdA/CDA1 family)